MKFADYLFYITIIAILIVLNGIFNLKVINLAVTIPEIIVVVYLLFRKRTTQALFWHTIFFITSFINAFSEEFVFLNGIISTTSYNYANLSFHGLRYSLIITYIILFVQQSHNRIPVTTKQTVFYKFYKFLLYCVTTGFALGIFGLIFVDYSLGDFLDYGYYALFCFGFALSFMYEYETTLKDDLYNLVPYILSIGVLFNFTCRLFDLRENLIVIGGPSMTSYVFILIPLCLFKKKIIPVLLVIGVELYLMTVTTSGKLIYAMFMMFAATLVLSFSNGIRGTIGRFNQSKIHLLLILAIVGYPVLKSTMSTNADAMEESNMEYKMNSVESLTNFFTGKGQLHEISDSPYTRIAEFANIVYEDIRNPIYLTVGRGFGGYYRDELHLFNNISSDLTNGAFSFEQVRTGKFSYGHDTFVTVPMLNGFIGFIWLIYLVITMCKQSTKNYLYLSSLMFLLLWFYFDVLLGVTGIMLLFAAEHRVKQIM